ncbi:hypothetical protein DKM44_06240 [Deinococcus irradiatisoli]|uniref:Uncharacterized protein n=1 Tax=Deinococcus irradiatisoli TaxID=2202254 RepID=A0A2Z3JFW9_9DEIO|nr:hypothetical protein [Deinococcus irradiatisoli]AWN22876.1 hypothetical protein DKM44_06240 [Deinococcus irradiatisoli]
MSRAFVKEDGAGRWEAPATAKAYRVVWTGRGEGEVLRESDDLVELLLWARGRPQGSYALHSAEGTLLAQVHSAA